MSKYEGTYKCGHQGETNIVGSHKTRQWRAENYFASHICEECWKAEKEAEKKQAEKKATKKKLVALKGSPKQRAWAVSIRQSIIDRAEMMEVSGSGTFQEILKNNSANFWIENRHSDIPAIVGRIENQKKANEIYDFYMDAVDAGINIEKELEKIGFAFNVPSLSALEERYDDIRVTVSGYIYDYEKI